jgi:hypothetical protein
MKTHVFISLSKVYRIISKELLTMLPGDSRTGDWVEFFDGDHEPDSQILKVL